VTIAALAPVTLAVAGTKGPSVYWYLTRSTGIVALVVLTAVVVAGILTTLGWSAPWWPRFFSRAVHRNLSLFATVLVAVHVFTTVLDGFVPVGLLDGVVPFQSPYKTAWLALGTISFDLMLVLLVTSALRFRIGYQGWRALHWLAYLMWPLAFFHAAGMGTDARLGPVQLLGLLCLAAVVGAAIYRLAAGGLGGGDPAASRRDAPAGVPVRQGGGRDGVYR
jgi:DMSO/TMAO reductase YedYZ heme-binding membrane subunit